MCEVEGCGYQTKSKAGLTLHKRIHSHPFHCNVCYKWFATKKCFQNHKYIHSKDKSFKCDQCSKSFSINQNLQAHIKYFHKPNNNDRNDSDSDEDKELKCITRSKAKTIKRKYNRMKIIDKAKVTCTFPDCCAVPSNKKHLSQHKNINSKKIFKCNYKGCKKVLNSRFTLSRHKIKHLGKFKCDKCNYIGECLAKLNKHKGKHSEERPIKCQHCDKCFKDNYGSLRRHIERTHPDQCPDLPLLKCQVNGCQYRTKSKDALILHKRNHILQFECNVCHKRFSRNNAFEIHKYIHLKDKPFKCDQCSKSFPGHRNLQRHINNLHKPKIIGCDIKECGKDFSTARSSRQQMKITRKVSNVSR